MAPTSKGMFQSPGGLLVHVVLHILPQSHFEYGSRVIDRKFWIQTPRAGLPKDFVFGASSLFSSHSQL